MRLAALLAKIKVAYIWTINNKGIKMFTLQLPYDIEHKVNTLIKKTGQSKSSFIKEALTFYLKELEDIRFAEDVLQRIRDGREKIYTIEEVEKELGLED